MRVDIAIVGGGFAGLSCARHLKEADPALEIVVLEQRHIGFGASGRNAGILSPFLPVPWLIDCTSGARRLDDARFAVRYIQGETEALLNLIRREGIACDLQKTSIITTGANGFFGRYLRLIGERCDMAGIPGHLATRDELRETIPFASHGGFVLEGYALQPMALLQGLRLYAERLGVRICENAPVTGIRATQQAVTVRTETDACITAGKVIVATNAYTGQSGPASAPGIPKPLITYLLATVPLERPLREELGLERRTIVDIGREYFYARIFQDRVLFGGFDRADSPAEQESGRQELVFKRLRAEMVRRFPLLRDGRIEAQWSGLYHQSRKHVPILRPVESEPGVILNVGYGGVGVTLTQFSGRLAANMILGGRRQDHDSERMRRLYASTRFPVKETVKMGLRLALSWRQKG